MTDAEKLNLGCGHDYRDGWCNVDVDPAVERDHTVDLETDDWPLPSDHFQTVLADNVFEHIEPSHRPTFLDECHRVLASDGELVMRWPLPGVGGGWDVTHYQIPSWEWPDHPQWGASWELVERAFRWSTLGKWLPNRVARELAWHGIRTAIGVEVVVRPVEREPPEATTATWSGQQ